jgi:hypothetical protein
MFFKTFAVIGVPTLLWLAVAREAQTSRQSWPVLTLVSTDIDGSSGRFAMAMCLRKAA